MRTKKSILFALLSLLAFGGCTQSQKNNKASEPLKVIRVGYFPVTNPLILVAQRDSLFRKNGTNVKIEYVKSTNGPTLVEAFLGNKIDVALFGDQPAIIAWAKGVDIKAVANFPLSSKNTWIMTSDPQHIKSMKDLKGKKIAVQIGTISQHWLFMSLQQAGMSVNDVQMINLPAGDGLISLANKQIDAAVLSEPNISLCETRKIAAKVIGSQCPKAYSELLMVSGELYRNHSEAVKSIVATYDEANSWVIDHPKEAVDLIGTKVTYKVPKDVLYRQYRARTKVKYIAFTYSSVDSYRKVVGFLKDLKAIPRHGTVADSIQKLYDPRFINEIYKEKAKHNQLTEANIKENGRQNSHLQNKRD
jgi:sulfonate transport system substrate-binding protein